MFRISSSSKRSARESWRTTRICAGVIGCSSGSGSGGSGIAAVATAAAGRSASAGAAGAVGGASGLGLGLFLEPGGLAGRALAPAAAGLLARWAGQEPAQELAQSLQHRPRAARQQPPPLSGSSLPSLCSKHLLPRARPTNPSAVEVYAEADAGASQVHHVAFVIRQLEAEVPQSNRASQVHHVVLVGIGFHDVSHALLADDLGDDVVAQRAHRVRSVGQAAAAEIQLVVGVHLHECEDLAAALQEAGAQQMVDALRPAGGGARGIGAAAGELGAQLLVVQDEAVAVVRHGDLVSGLAVGGAREVAADPRGQAHAGVGARGQLRPIQSAEGGVLPVEVGATVGAQEGICDPDLKDAEPRGALQVHRLAYVKLEVLVAPRRALPAIYPDRRRRFFPSTEPPACWAGHAGGGVRRVRGDLLRPGLRLLPLLLHPGRLGWVVDARVGGGRGAAANVLALALEQRAAAQELAEDRPQELPHRRSSRRSRFLAGRRARSGCGTSFPAGSEDRCRGSYKARPPRPRTSPQAAAWAPAPSAPPAGCPSPIGSSISKCKRIGC